MTSNAIEFDDYVWLLPIASVLLGLGLFAWDGARGYWTRRRLGVDRSGNVAASQHAAAQWLSTDGAKPARRLRTADFLSFGAVLTLVAPGLVAALVPLDRGELVWVVLLLLPLPVTAWWLELRDRGVADAYVAPVAGWMVAHVVWIAATLANGVYASDAGFDSLAELGAAWAATVSGAAWPLPAVLVAVAVATIVIVGALATAGRGSGEWRAAAVVAVAAMVGSIVWSGAQEGAMLAWGAVWFACIGCSRATRRERQLAALRRGMAVPDAKEQIDQRPGELIGFRQRDELRVLVFPVVAGALAYPLLTLAVAGAFWLLMAVAMLPLAVLVPFGWASTRPTNASATLFAIAGIVAAVWSFLLTVYVGDLVFEGSLSLQIPSDSPWGSLGGAANVVAMTVSGCVVLSVLARLGVVRRWGGLVLPIALSPLFLLWVGDEGSSVDYANMPFVLFKTILVAAVISCAWALLGPARMREKPEESAVREMRLDGLNGERSLEAAADRAVSALQGATVGGRTTG